MINLTALTVRQLRHMALECRIAKQRLAISGREFGKLVHICNALNDTSASDRVRTVIASRIRPSHSITNWLVSNKMITYEYSFTNEGAAEIQAYRHQWLDALTAEFDQLAEEKKKESCNNACIVGRSWA